jgi:tetratricopeptide (TPR) repeat protein
LDPGTVISIFDNETNWDGNEKAAAEYLVALAYMRGEFEGAIESDIDPLTVSGEEEWRERISDKYEELRAEGSRRLNDVYLQYQDSPIAVLARLDFLISNETQKQNVSIGEWNTLVSFVEEKFPNTAFATKCYTIIGSRYKNSGDVDRAVDSYKKALECSDYQTFRNGVTCHDQVNELISEIGGE